MAEGGDTKTLVAAKATYKKAEGYLYLTDQPYRIVWVNGQTGAVPVQFFTNDCTNLYANKSGMKPPKLRIVANNQEFNFVFTADEPFCFANRDAFRDHVKSLIREGMTQSQSQTPGGGSDGQTPSENEATTPTMIEDAGPSQPPSAALPDTPAATPSIDPVKELAAKMFRLRKKILLRDPELALHHRAGVINGKLSEADFWASRQHLIDETAKTEGQKRGKSSRLVDPKPAVSGSGDMRFIMTPQLAQDIFEEWPVVLQAFRDNVPGKMSEAEFWKRYFESRLYHNHKASVRSSAAQHVIKEDTIFDKYLEPVDDDVEPRHSRQDPVSRLVDLAATSEDHAQTGNTQDLTMQAGKQKSSLPLIRKFNEHSERLLNSALGEVKPVKRRRLETAPDSTFDEIDMEDLHGNDNNAGIALDMKNRQRYFEGRSGPLEPVTNTDFKLSVRSMKSQLNEWKLGLKNVPQDPKSGLQAFKLISDNIVSRTKVKTSKLDVSAEFFKQMQALEAAANEYLRQFWFLVYPPPDGVTRLSPEERGKKAAAMRDQLVWVQKRAPELVNAAAMKRWDSAGVEEALKPMMGAVDKALGFVAGRR